MELSLVLNARQIFITAKLIRNVFRSLFKIVFKGISIARNVWRVN